VNETRQDNVACCPLCPALCGLTLAYNGPDLPRAEVPLQPGQGACPRGTSLGELMGSFHRLRRCLRRSGERTTEARFADAVAEAARRIDAEGATVILDAASLPLEELAAAAEIAAAWPRLQICAALAPEDEQMLAGLEASGTTYLADEELARCDGLLLIGDPLAANPRCARGVLDALKANSRMPVVAVDGGGGVSASYASLPVLCGPGGELDALRDRQVAAALEPCRKLGVVIAAAGGRGGIWARVGFEAGKLASAHRGGVAAQTTGGNALGAFRAARSLGLCGLAEAMAPGQGANLRAAVGVDVLALLGWTGPSIAVAAAAMPGVTTGSADIVFPLALPGEIGGTFLQAGTRRVTVAALLPPPAGVPAPSALMRQLAEAARVKVPAFSGRLPALDRAAAGEPPEPTRASPPVEPESVALVGARESIHHADGSLTGAASWQGQLRPLPELRVSGADAARMGLAGGDEVEVATESSSARLRVRVTENVPAGTVAAVETSAATRRLTPYVIDSERNALVSHPAGARVTPKPRAVATVEAGPPRHMV